MLLSLLLACGTSLGPVAAIAGPDTAATIAVRGGGPGAVWLLGPGAPVRVMLPGSDRHPDATARLAGDLDQDGAADVLLGSSAGAWVVLSGDGPHPTGRPLPVPAGVRLGGGVRSVPDLDADGRMDVVAEGARAGAPVRVVYGTAGPSVTVLASAVEGAE